MIKSPNDILKVTLDEFNFSVFIRVAKISVVDKFLGPRVILKLTEFGSILDKILVIQA